MPAATQMRVAARVIAILCLAGLSGSGAVAQLAPPIQMAALAPAEEAHRATPAPAHTGPFGMASTHGGTMPAKWRILQPAIAMEIRLLDSCRADPQSCTPAAARFLSIVDTARARAGRARIGEINRAINLAIRPESDVVRFGAPDVWTTPLTTFAAGAGDCEDYAIAKYVALREAGVAPEDLRIVIVRNLARAEDHAVAAARVDDQWLILDNRHMLLLNDSQATGLTPLVTLDHNDGPETFTVAQAG